MGPLRSAAETLSVEGGFVQRKSDRAAMTRAANRARLTGPGRPALPSGRHIRGEARMKTNSKGKRVCVVIGATSKWQSDGRNTVLAHGHPIDGRDLPPDMELLEYIPVEMFDVTQHIACRGPFLVAKEVLPAMRKKGQGSFFFSNNSSSLRGKKRMTGQSLYYPRVMMRTLAQVLTEEYSEHGVHVANIVIDGTIDSPGTRALPRNQNRRDHIINPEKIAEAFYYLHTQDRSCWTHELQLTPFPTKPSY